MIRRAFTPLRGLRRRPIWFWTVVLLYFTLGLGAWIALVQPAYGQAVTLWAWGAFAAWLIGLVGLLAADFDAEQARHMGAILGKSRWTGVLISLTTLAILFFAAEMYLRVFYITTDGYGFTLMNNYWYRNFGFVPWNSAGYRDYEPQTGEGITHIAVLGDSFAMGHGINDIDDTFPQLLEQRLGAGYDVNLVAQAAWNTDVQLENLKRYPISPDVLILSYYLNDMDYLRVTAETSAFRQFRLPENPTLLWFVFNFCVPNFIYFNVMQYTSADLNTNVLNDMLELYQEDQFWSRQARQLGEIRAYAEQNAIPMIVLLWPHLLLLDESQPAVRRVREFMVGQGVPVVDLTETLRAHSSSNLIVNPFDTHPGIAAHRLAADALYPALLPLLESESE